MPTLTQIKQTLVAHKSEITEKYSVSEIGIFGSYVRGEQTEKSDIDILVDFNRGIGFFKFLELEELLGTMLHRKVDLVSKQGLKPIIGDYILREVILL